MDDFVEKLNLNTDILVDGITKATERLLAQQQTDGHWCSELEADCTIPAEYILMLNFTGEPDDAYAAKFINYFLHRQNSEGGWPLYYGGESDISCSVKVYYALKIMGESIDSDHMVRARECILRMGGAAKANVFTRITLALFEQVPWRAVPFIPAEIILLPKWFPFHIDKVSYWSRTVMVPLFILCTLKPRAKNPKKINIKELFVTPAWEEKNYFPTQSLLSKFFLALDKMGRACETFVPKFIRMKSIRACEKWFVERINGLDGLGAIFPAMVNAYEALFILGYEKNNKLLVEARESIENLLVIKETEAYCQPCVSPVWDTGLGCLALQEVNSPEAIQAVEKGLDWLATKQLLSEKGDWQVNSPDLAGGGWAFQYNNSYYPDVDDTAVIAWTMELSKKQNHKEAIDRSIHWLAGMQSSNGGFGAFDIDNTYYYLNEIPFADHGALLDPPTADVSARCLTAFAILNKTEHHEIINLTKNYLISEQETNGSWFGRWGTNYIYGTWSVIMGLKMAGMADTDPVIQKACDWLISQQRVDGGWGENNDSYIDAHLGNTNCDSTSFQTAWALISLLECGYVNHQSVKNGIAYLLSTQQEHGLWQEDWFTCPGFPRVFYLKYHGYSKYFPLWALAKYNNSLKKGAA